MGRPLISLRLMLPMRRHSNIIIFDYFIEREHEEKIGNETRASAETHNTRKHNTIISVLGTSTEFSVYNIIYNYIYNYNSVFQLLSDLNNTLNNLNNNAFLNNVGVASEIQ